MRRRQQTDLSTAAFPSLGQAASGTASNDSTAMTVLAVLRRLQIGASVSHPVIRCVQYVETSCLARMLQAISLTQCP